MKIREFREDYMFLSNFYDAPVMYGNLRYRNSEAAFQAQKCLTEREKLAFANMSPAVAKREGLRVRLRPDWEEVKLGIMEEILYAKFTQNRDLKRKLLETGDAILEEGNKWHDTYWGVDIRTGRGENHLGKALMKVRARLQPKKP